MHKASGETIGLAGLAPPGRSSAEAALVAHFPEARAAFRA